MVKLLKRWRRPRPRARLAWLGLWALLLQQLALVAYACPLESVDAGQATLMVGCEEMSAPDPDAPALCDQHCQRDHIATADAKAPQVPYQPALAAFALVQALLPPVHAQFYRDVPVCVSDPPPCSASVAC
ncbi:hypothetical protein [Xanthomonas citri]|uniref:hypothetical protein n=1 Tax=Xanthomonas citri TaxID=346 RepID=UPI000AD9B677|nr:hypothetical protein [Xanthomonas citri]